MTNSLAHETANSKLHVGYKIQQSASGYLTSTKTCVKLRSEGRTTHVYGQQPG